jgi:hypothetical protein
MLKNQNRTHLIQIKSTALGNFPNTCRKKEIEKEISEALENKPVIR